MPVFIQNSVVCPALPVANVDVVVFVSACSREKKSLTFHLPAAVFASNTRLIAILVCQSKAAAKQDFFFFLWRCVCGWVGTFERTIGVRGWVGGGVGWGLGGAK